jgi:hypothetical protein
VRVRDDSLDYLTLADSPIVVRTACRGLVPITDDRLAHLPGGRPYAYDLVRSLRNQPGGFWVASTDPGAAYNAVSGTIPLEDGGGEVALVTDGISRLVEFYGHDWEQVFAVLRACGPAGLISMVRSAERAKPLAHAKQHDDATVVLLTCYASSQARAERPQDWRSLVGL